MRAPDWRLPPYGSLGRNLRIADEVKAVAAEAAATPAQIALAWLLAEGGTRIRHPARRGRLSRDTGAPPVQTVTV